MKFKKDAEGNLILDDNGNPIIILDDGTEKTFIPADKLSEVNRESAARRHKIKEYEEQLAKFQGIDIEEYKKLKQEAEERERKKKEDEGRYQELLAEQQKKHQEELKKLKEKYEALTRKRQTEKVKTAILQAASKVKAAEADILAELLSKKVRYVEQDDKEYYEVLDPETGQPKLNTSGAPMTVEEFVAEFIEERPRFKDPGPGGPGGGPKDTPGGTIKLTWDQIKDPAVYDQYREKYLAGEVTVVDE